MANCHSCSAPLPVNTSFCNYCGLRNDLDVLGMKRFAEGREESPRYCPDCKVPMETIRLSADGAFAVESCSVCFGLFFDPGEVQSFLDAMVTPAFVVNYQEIVNINNERANIDRPVRYLPCPDCGKFMNRVSFGFNSGVVIDQCKAHGVWLDNGELIHLMEWKRAGGELRVQQRAQEHRQEVAAGAEKRRLSLPLGEEIERSENPVHDLVNSAVNLLTRLFG